mgnify:CR=1 FL=1
MTDNKMRGWTANTEQRVEHLYSPFTKWNKLTDKFVKLHSKYDLPVENLENLLKNIVNKHPLESIIINPQTMKKRLTYRGIGLTRREKTLDPIYEASQYYNSHGEFVSSAKALGRDGINLEGSKNSDFEREFIIANDVATDFTKNLQSLFTKWTATKIRIMELHPSGVIPPHLDHPYYNQIRIHTVINSNPHVFWEVEGEQFQIPADGSFYWFDTGRIHSVSNLGKTPRSVLSIHLCPPLDNNDSPKVGNLIESLTQGLL